MRRAATPAQTVRAGTPVMTGPKDTTILFSFLLTSVRGGWRWEGIHWGSARSCALHLFTEDCAAYLATFTGPFSPPNARVEMLIHIRNRGNGAMGCPSQVFSYMFWMLLKDRTAAPVQDGRSLLPCTPVTR